MAGNGLRTARSQGMEGYTGNQAEFSIDPSNANAIFTGDPVVLSGGNIVAATVAANPILGIFMGCRYEDSDGSVKWKNQWDGNTGRTNVRAIVSMPQNSMCWIKGEAGVNFQPATSIGAAHPFDINSGNPATGDSGFALAAPGAGPVVVHRLADIPGNAWGTGEPILEVSVNLLQGTFADAS